MVSLVPTSKKQPLYSSPLGCLLIGDVSEEGTDLSWLSTFICSRNVPYYSFLDLKSK